MATDTHVMALDGAKMRVLYVCTGVGIMNRGIESFFQEAFDGLKDTPNLASKLVKGAGQSREKEVRALCIPRTARTARLLGKLLGRNAYVAEQLSSFPSVVRQIRKFHPHIVFYSDANLGFQLYRWRNRIGFPFRLLFSNGGPCRAPFPRTDYVHQVAPFYFNEALRAGEPAEKHFMVPYGIAVSGPPASILETKHAARKRLGLPLERPVVLSVGWISRQHKRMHYVIEEIAQLPEPRPFLQLLGAMDANSHEIVELGNHLLSKHGFSARSVPYQQVFDYYKAADCFVLASLQEGFGRVFLEALMHGLPVIANHHPVMRYIIDDVGITADLSDAGALARHLPAALQREEQSYQARCKRWRSIRDRFSWEALSPQYFAMFRRCAQPGPKDNSRR